MLETQVKHKANAADLEDRRKTVLEDLNDKVTVDKMNDMQAMINDGGIQAQDGGIHKQQQDSGDWVYRVVGHLSMWSIKRLKKRSPPQPAGQSSQHKAQNGTPAAPETVSTTGPPVEPELPQGENKNP